MLAGVYTAVTGNLLGFISISESLGAAMVLGFGIWGIVVGIVVILGGMAIQAGKIFAGSATSLIFNGLGLVTGQGFVIGPVLGIIGGAVGFKTKTK